MYRHYKTDFPNQAHQLLVSVSKHFVIGARNIIRFQKKMMAVSLKSFEKSEREHLVYYILRDHFSGFYYIEVTSTKNIIPLQDFLLRGFLLKPDIDFCGVPSALMIPKQVEDYFPPINTMLEDMMNIGVTAYSASPIWIAGFMLLSSIILFTGCSSGDLSRRQTVTAISEAANYKQAATTSIDVGMLTNAYARAWQLSKDEKEEEAVVRAKEDFKTKQPQLVIAEQLGYIRLRYENPKMRGPEIGMPRDLYDKGLGEWEFNTRAELTDAGRALWKDAGLNVNEMALPLAVREAPEITGIVDEDKITKKVEFTYRWKPNKLGQSLDPNSAAFNELPEDVKQIIKTPKFNLFGTTSQMVNFTEVRKGVAYFRKYDDGWRMQNLTLG